MPYDYGYGSILKVPDGGGLPVVTKFGWSSGEYNTAYEFLVSNPDPKYPLTDTMYRLTAFSADNKTVAFD